MRGREQTPQQLDPVGTLLGLPMVPLTAIVALGYAVFATLLHGDQVSRPAIAVIALLVLALACGLFVLSARPAASPLRRTTHFLIMSLAVLASVLFTISVWGTNRYVQDDWGQIGVGLLLVSMSLFRPAWEIVGAGVVCSLILGGIAMSEAPFLAIRNNPLIYGIVVAAPILILSVAAAAYSRVMTTALQEWSERATEAIARLEPEVRAGAARAVHQEQVTRLNEATVPFFTSVLERDELTADDIAQAREIAARLRASTVADLDRGWLGEAIRRATAEPGHVLEADEPGVRDPGHLASYMGSELRGTLSAFIVALARTERLESRSLSVDVLSLGQECSLSLRARVNASDRTLRRVLVPYLSVFRVIATDATLRVRSGTVSLDFTYESSGDGRD
jgi:multisubunit Na+/H+ antiporter MnhB subunit